MAYLVDVCVLVYLDNILIFSKNEISYITHVHMVFDYINNAGRHIERSKCIFFTKIIDFFGYVVSYESVSICHTKNDTIKIYYKLQQSMISIHYLGYISTLEGI